MAETEPQNSPGWCWIQHGPREPFWNMAMDEALLENATHVQRPLLRFYGWTVPAATFGYFQRHAEIETLTPLRPLIRRPTAGGLVPHDRDWTYSLAVPPTHPWYELRATESYERIHRWVQSAFATLGIATELAAAPDPSGPGQCFIGAETHDLLFQRRKIAGAAQRRNRWGLLIQGSVQPAAAWMDRRHVWEQSMIQAGLSLLGPDGHPATAAEIPEARGTELASGKYSDPAYLRRR